MGKEAARTVSIRTTPASVVVVGGGIVGLATAYALQQEHGLRNVIVLEKEDRIASHQSGRNSGVIHSGIYYRPGSMKAENCRDGKRKLADFCERHGVYYDMCGKVIVAVSAEEKSGLRRIYDRGLANGIACRLISGDELREMEPHAAGVEAIHVPEAGIADYRGMCERLAALVEENGGRIRTSHEVTGIRRTKSQLIVETSKGEVHCDYLVNCAGLYADRIARMTGRTPSVRVIPFRGEYYELQPERRYLCRNLIYPVPDPAFPFLGVHVTRMFDGRVECGPSAILALAREGYSLGKINLRDVVESMTYPGLLRLMKRHWRKGILEIRQSISKDYYALTLQRLIPEISPDDLVPADSGVRAQAIDRQGNLLDDFYFEETDRVVNVCNAASPAATASLNVGSLVAGRLAARF